MLAETGVHHFGDNNNELGHHLREVLPRRLHVHHGPKRLRHHLLAARRRGLSRGWGAALRVRCAGAVAGWSEPGHLRS